MDLDCISKLETNFNFICHCGKRYSHKKSLWNHQNFECGGKTPQFKCPCCPHRASRKGNLKNHFFTKHQGSGVVWPF